MLSLVADPPQLISLRGRNIPRLRVARITSFGFSLCVLQGLRPHEVKGKRWGMCSRSGSHLSK